MPNSTNSPSASPKGLQLGTAHGKAGTVVRGCFQLVALPTGGFETIPVIIAMGNHPGPTLLVTANIHGDEVVGTLVCHRFIESLDLKKLQGQVVVLPSLNPSGLRALTRFSELQGTDPNRKWPSSHPSADLKWEDAEDWLAGFTALEFSPGPQERAWKQLFEAIRGIRPDFHIDLHSFTALSIPFSFHDRVFYTTDEKAAEALGEKSRAMLQAVGFSVFREASFRNMLKTDMFRTTSGAIQNGLQIPAATIELGMSTQSSFENREAAVTGLTNLLKWAGMIEGTPVELKNITVLQPSKPHRVLQYPYAPVSGILDPIVGPGASFKKGDVLGIFRSVSGEPLADLKSDFDGYLIGWRRGIAHYEGNPLAWVAVEDKMPLVRTWVA
jgi:uncharacterized protein